MSVLAAALVTDSTGDPPRRGADVSGGQLLQEHSTQSFPRWTSPVRVASCESLHERARLLGLAGIVGPGSDRGGGPVSPSIDHVGELGEESTDDAEHGGAF